MAARAPGVAGARTPYRPLGSGLPRAPLHLWRYRRKLPLQRYVVLRLCDTHLERAQVRRLHSRAARGTLGVHGRRYHVHLWRPRRRRQRPRRPRLVQDHEPPLVHVCAHGAGAVWALGTHDGHGAESHPGDWRRVFHRVGTGRPDEPARLGHDQDQVPGQDRTLGRQHLQVERTGRTGSGSGTCACACACVGACACRGGACARHELDVRRRRAARAVAVHGRAARTDTHRPAHRSDHGAERGPGRVAGRTAGRRAGIPPKCAGNVASAAERRVGGARRAAAAVGHLPEPCTRRGADTWCACGAPPHDAAERAAATAPPRRPA